MKSPDREGREHFAPMPCTSVNPLNIPLKAIKGLPQALEENSADRNIEKSTDMISDRIKVVVRSIGERTTAACIKSIVSQGFPRDSISVVTAYPFSEALRQSLCVGLDARKDWTLIIDADVVLRSDAVARILRVADSRPANVCEVHGLVLDKLFGEFRLAGNHMYRTSMIPIVLDCISYEGQVERPETSALRAAAAKGHPFQKVALAVGIHDYEQKYADIFRKGLLQSYKHLGKSGDFLCYWRDNMRSDTDYRVALEGFAFGLIFRPEVLVNAADDQINAAFSSLEIPEKSAAFDISDPAMHAMTVTNAAMFENTLNVDGFDLEPKDLLPENELHNLTSSRAQRSEKILRDHGQATWAVHMVGKLMFSTGLKLMVPQKARRVASKVKGPLE